MRIQRINIDTMSHSPCTCVQKIPADPCGNNGRHLWLPIPLVMQLITDGYQVFYSFQSKIASVMGGNSKVPIPGTWR